MYICFKVKEKCIKMRKASRRSRRKISGLFLMLHRCFSAAGVVRSPNRRSLFCAADMEHKQVGGGERVETLKNHHMVAFRRPRGDFKNPTSQRLHVKVHGSLERRHIVAERKFSTSFDFRHPDDSHRVTRSLR